MVPRVSAARGQSRAARKRGVADDCLSGAPGARIRARRSAKRIAIRLGRGYMDWGERLAMVQEGSS